MLSVSLIPLIYPAQQSACDAETVNV